jgi:hypothetical protein
MHSDTDHLSHRMQNIGFSQRGMLASLLVVHAVCCAVGIVFVKISLKAALWAAGSLTAVLAVAAVALDRHSSRDDLWTEGRRGSR